MEKATEGIKRRIRPAVRRIVCRIFRKIRPFNLIADGQCMKLLEKTAGAMLKFF
jgi:hypothetical protein